MLPLEAPTIICIEGGYAVPKRCFRGKMKLMCWPAMREGDLNCQGLRFWCPFSRNSSAGRSDSELSEMADLYSKPAW